MRSGEAPAAAGLLPNQTLDTLVEDAVGGTTRFWIPPKLALGDNPPPPMPKGPTVWDVTLKAIETH